MNRCSYAGCPKRATVTLDGWDFCPGCSILHASETVGADAAADIAPVPPQTDYCGSVIGFEEHLAANATPCRRCVKAYNDAQRSKRKRLKQKAAAGHTDSAVALLGIARWTGSQGEVLPVQQVPRLKRHERSGHRGIAWEAKTGRWAVTTTVEGKRRRHGTYLTVAEAVEVQQAAYAELQAPGQVAA